MTTMAAWAKGRGHGSEAALKVLKYIPRARTPWAPSSFRRENLTLEDLTKMWGMGRAKYGAGHYNSGYSTIKQHVVDDANVEVIPKHELEKYMPNIYIGPKALVTPVSVMNARGGHRITHDLIHSYDAHIGRVEKDAMIDHDKVHPLDPNQYGLHGNALDCRGRIYRWLRRGPFFNEDQYFRRYVTAENMTEQSKEVEVPQEVPLHKKIIRLCKQGNLKSACETYRKLTHPPPVQVYRALTAACVPHGQIADAVAIFEEGNSKLFYIARDGEVLLNVVNAAIVAKNRSRIMWTLNVARGRYYENQFVRAEVDPMYRYRIATAAITFFLDHGCGEEARSVYTALREDGMLHYDVFIRLGEQMGELLAKGEGLPRLDEKSMVASCSLQVNALNFTPLIAEHVSKQQTREQKELHGSKRLKSAAGGGGFSEATPQEALSWLQRCFPDVDVLFVARHARFQHGRDLMALEDQSLFVARVVDWLDVLSAKHDELEGAALPYLRKSKASATTESIRIAWLPERRKKTRMLPGELGFDFFFSPTTRFVDEIFPQLPAGAEMSIRSKFLALEPTHVEVSCAASFTAGREVVTKTKNDDAVALDKSSKKPTAILEGKATKILHPSLFATTPAATAAATPAGSSAAGTGAAAVRTTSEPAFH